MGAELVDKVCPNDSVQDDRKVKASDPPRIAWKAVAKHIWEIHQIYAGKVSHYDGLSWLNHDCFDQEYD